MSLLMALVDHVRPAAFGQSSHSNTVASSATIAVLICGFFFFCILFSDGSGSVSPSPGYWSSSLHIRPFECADSTRCPGGAPNQCQNGYTGIACSKCEKEYFRSDNRCWSCGSDLEASVWVIASLTIGVIWLIILSLALTFLPPASIAAFVFVVVLLQHSFGIGRIGLANFSMSSSNRIAALIFLSLGLLQFEIETFRPGCAQMEHIDYATYFAVTILYIAIGMICVCTTGVLASAWLKVRAREAQPGAHTHTQRAATLCDDPAAVTDATGTIRRVRAIIAFFVVAHFKLVEIGLAMVSCQTRPDPIDDSAADQIRLRGYPHAKCFADTDHIIAGSAALFLLVCVVIVIPIFYLFFLSAYVARDGTAGVAGWIRRSSRCRSKRVKPDTNEIEKKEIKHDATTLPPPPVAAAAYAIADDAIEISPDVAASTHAPTPAPATPLSSSWPQRFAFVFVSCHSSHSAWPLSIFLLNIFHAAIRQFLPLMDVSFKLILIEASFLLTSIGTIYQLPMNSFKRNILAAIGTLMQAGLATAFIGLQRTSLRDDDEEYLLYISIGLFGVLLLFALFRRLLSSLLVVCRIRVSLLVALARGSDVCEFDPDHALPVPVTALASTTMVTPTREEEIINGSKHQPHTHTIAIQIDSNEPLESKSSDRYEDDKKELLMFDPKVPIPEEDEEDENENGNGNGVHEDGGYEDDFQIDPSVADELMAHVATPIEAESNQHPPSPSIDPNQHHHVETSPHTNHTVEPSTERSSSSPSILPATPHDVMTPTMMATTANQTSGRNERPMADRIPSPRTAASPPSSMPLLDASTQRSSPSLLEVVAPIVIVDPASDTFSMSTSNAAAASTSPSPSSATATSQPEANGTPSEIEQAGQHQTLGEHQQSQQAQEKIRHPHNAHDDHHATHQLKDDRDDDHHRHPHPTVKSVSSANVDVPRAVPESISLLASASSVSASASAAPSSPPPLVVVPPRPHGEIKPIGELNEIVKVRRRIVRHADVTHQASSTDGVHVSASDEPTPAELQREVDRLIAEEEVTELQQRLECAYALSNLPTHSVLGHIAIFLEDRSYSNSHLSPNPLHLYDALLYAIPLVHEELLQEKSHLLHTHRDPDTQRVSTIERESEEWLKQLNRLIEERAEKGYLRLNQRKVLPKEKRIIEKALTKYTPIQQRWLSHLFEFEVFLGVCDLIVLDESHRYAALQSALASIDSPRTILDRHHFEVSIKNVAQQCIDTTGKAISMASEEHAKLVQDEQERLKTRHEEQLKTNRIKQAKENIRRRKEQQQQQAARAALIARDAERRLADLDREAATPVLARFHSSSVTPLSIPKLRLPVDGLFPTPVDPGDRILLPNSTIPPAAKEWGTYWNTPFRGAANEYDQPKREHQHQHQQRRQQTTTTSIEPNPNKTNTTQPTQPFLPPPSLTPPSMPTTEDPSSHPLSLVLPKIDLSVGSPLSLRSSPRTPIRIHPSPSSLVSSSSPFLSMSFSSPSRTVTASRLAVASPHLHASSPISTTHCQIEMSTTPNLSPTRLYTPTMRIEPTTIIRSETIEATAAHVACQPTQQTLSVTSPPPLPNMTDSFLDPLDEAGESSDSTGGDSDSDAAGDVDVSPPPVAPVRTPLRRAQPASRCRSPDGYPDLASECLDAGLYHIAALHLVDSPPAHIFKDSTLISLASGDRPPLTTHRASSMPRELPGAQSARALSHRAMTPKRARGMETWRPQPEVTTTQSSRSEALLKGIATSRIPKSNPVAQKEGQVPPRAHTDRNSTSLIEVGPGESLRVAEKYIDSKNRTGEEKLSRLRFHLQDQLA